MMHECVIHYRGIRFSIFRDNREVGHAYLYFLMNDHHERPFGLLEDVFVDPLYRGRGIAREIIDAVVEKVRYERCYKLIATSRDDGTREAVHAWYVRRGFTDYGTEFRMNF